MADGGPVNGDSSGSATLEIASLERASEYFSMLPEQEAKKLQKRRLWKLKDSFSARVDRVENLSRELNIVLKFREKEVNPSHEPLQIEAQRDAALAEMDEPMEGHILLIDEAVVRTVQP